MCYAVYYIRTGGTSGSHRLRCAQVIDFVQVMKSNHR